MGQWLEHFLPLQETWVSFPAPTGAVIPVPGFPTLSSDFHLVWHAGSESAAKHSHTQSKNLLGK